MGLRLLILVYKISSLVKIIFPQVLTVFIFNKSCVSILKAHKHLKYNYSIYQWINDFKNRLFGFLLELSIHFSLKYWKHASVCSRFMICLIKCWSICSDSLRIENTQLWDTTSLLLPSSVKNQPPERRLSYQMTDCP